MRVHDAGQYQQAAGVDNRAVGMDARPNLDDLVALIAD